MHWVLILHIAGASSGIDQRVGLMATPEACEIAGQGMALILMARVPDVAVGWTCTPEASA